MHWKLSDTIHSADRKNLNTGESQELIKRVIKNTLPELPKDV